MSDLLNVYLNKDFIGVLSKDSNGGICFQYDKKAKHALSLSLPLRENIYPNKDCKGFFNGLLPESEQVRVFIGKRYGINPKNDFSLLQAIGYDCAGAVAFFKDKPKNLKEFHKIKGKILSETELEKYINELPKKPLAVGSDKRLSLAGAQDKTAVVTIKNEIAIPDDTIPSTHILKPAIQGFVETIENEYICLKSAEKIGISIPKIEIGKANNTKYFLIERYDREIKDGKIKRIHQEDFCQASNIPSAYKYQSEGGVDFKRCIEILKSTTKPAVAIKQFVEMMIFNYLIGNNDAHGKNFSILHYDDDTTAFAPAYDILCTSVYPELSQKMAMKIGGYYESDKIYPRHFERMAKDIGISYTQIKKILKNQCEILPDIVKEVSETFENSVGEKILQVVSENCTRNLKNF